MTNHFKIMIVDDESEMRKMIGTFLKAAEFEVYEARDGLEALKNLKKFKLDLIIIDVMMPFMDGFTLAKETKTDYDIPFIFLSAKGEEWDKVNGLKLGADDYIVKPFLPNELIARIEVVLRRTGKINNENKKIRIGPLTLNKAAYEFQLMDQPLNLTRKEFLLLETLVENKHRVFSRSQLLSIIWGEDHLSSERTVDTHIKTLRLKLGKHADLIKTVWGIGYRFEV